eukprot:276866_1
MSLKETLLQKYDSFDHVSLSKNDIDLKSVYVVSGFLRQCDQSISHIIPLILDKCISFYQTNNIHNFLVSLKGESLQLHEITGAAKKKKEDAIFVRNILLIAVIICVILSLIGFILYNTYDCDSKCTTNDGNTPDCTSDNCTYFHGFFLVPLSLGGIIICGVFQKHVQSNTDCFFFRKSKKGLLFDIEDECIKHVLFIVDYGYDKTATRRNRKKYLHEAIITMKDSKSICAFDNLTGIQWRRSGEVYNLVINYKLDNEVTPKLWASNALERKEFEYLYDNIQDIMERVDIDWRNRIFVKKLHYVHAAHALYQCT